MIKSKNGRIKSVSEEQITICAELRAKQVPWKECAARLGVSTQALITAVKRTGLCTGGKRGPAAIHTPDVLAKLVELRQVGHSWPECGKLLGFNWRSLRDKLYRSGVKAGGKRGRVGHITAAMIQQGEELRASGLGWVDCGKAIGINGQSLRAAMRRAGIAATGVAIGPTLIATPERMARAAELRAQGVCWKLIGRELGINSATLANAFWRMNRKARNGQ